MYGDGQCAAAGDALGSSAAVCQGFELFETKDMEARGRGEKAA